MTNEQNCSTFYYQLVAQCFVFVINYCSDIFRPKFMAMFRELVSIDVYRLCGDLRGRVRLYTSVSEYN